MTRTLVPLSLLSLTACQPGLLDADDTAEPKTYEACPDVEKVSVQVDVEGIDGVPLVPDELDWFSDRAEGDCEPGPGDSSTWSCGWEQGGTITVTAEKAGYLNASVDLFVGNDGCNVITESVTLVLEPDCVAGDEAPAAIVRVVNGDGEDLPQAMVYWQDFGIDDGGRNPCTPGGTEHLCGFGFVGTMDLWITAQGHDTETRQVTVEADVCDQPRTEHLTVELDGGPVDVPHDDEVDEGVGDWD